MQGSSTGRGDQDGSRMRWPRIKWVEDARERFNWVEENNKTNNDRAVPDEDTRLRAVPDEVSGTRLRRKEGSVKCEKERLVSIDRGDSADPGKEEGNQGGRGWTSSTDERITFVGAGGRFIAQSEDLPPP